MNALKLNRIVVALMIAGSCAVTGISLADAPAGAAKVARLSDGHPDFNGSWDNGSGYDFLKPQKGPDGSICIRVGELRVNLGHHGADAGLLDRPLLGR